MSNNYEIIQSFNQSKNNLINYTCTNIEDNSTYIIEIELINTNNKSLFIRHIIKDKVGILINDTNNIIYNLISAYKITIININKLDNIITLEGIIDKNDIIIVNNNIQITIINMNKIMHSFYNLIF
jgi:hypothetical protein